MLHNLQHGFSNGPIAPARLGAAIVFGLRTCEGSCWYKLPVRPEATHRDSVRHHDPNRQARPTEDGVALFGSFEEDSSSPNLRRQFWTYLTTHLHQTVRDL